MIFSFVIKTLSSEFGFEEKLLIIVLTLSFVLGEEEINIFFKLSISPEET